VSEDQLQHLLTVQDHDTRLAQLRHRFDTLAEREVLRDCEATQNQLEQQQQDCKMQLLEHRRTFNRQEEFLVALETRINQEEKRLYSGELTSTRDLLALQHEIEGLQMRCSEAESDVLELMEQVEQVNATSDALDKQLAQHASHIADARQQLASAEAEMQTEIDQEVQARHTATSNIAPEVLADYESLRKSLGGVAVARLREGICEGCHLALSTKELDRIRKLPVSEIYHSEECGCILVPV